MENFDAEINSIFSWKQPLRTAQQNMLSNKDYVCFHISRKSILQSFGIFCWKGEREEWEFQVWQYMEMFSILLLFTRAQRECILELYVTSFTSMIPLFMRHNHYNYARWRTIYVAEIKELPEEINEELVKGGFVVKCSTNMFNQVDPNHTQEPAKLYGKKRWWYEMEPLFQCSISLCEQGT